MPGRLLIGVALLFTVSVGLAHAQGPGPGVEQTVVAEGTADYAPEIGGPADIAIGFISLEPGARYGGWHTHPGSVWVIITRGEVTVYGPDGCPTVHGAGSAYRTEPDTLYDLRNESTAPASLAVAGVLRAGAPAGTEFIGSNGPTCGR